VNSPDLPGKACDLRQHSITLPNLNSIGLPNNPNFRLGAAPPGYCDSLILSVSPPQPATLPRITLVPNPGNQYSALYFDPLPNESHLAIYDATGQKWHEARVPGGEMRHEISTAEWPPGLYFVVLQLDNGKRSTTRLVVER
jgi:hypothetical protein